MDPTCVKADRIAKGIESAPRALLKKFETFRLIVQNF